MKRRAVLSWLSVVVLSSITLADSAKRVSISSGTLVSHVNYLASDELEGRGVGTEGIEKSAEYIAKQFEEYGLKPGGDDGSYFQTFEIPIRKKITDRCHLTVVGGELPCKFKKDFTPMPFSSSEAFEGPVAFVGFGITNEEQQYDDYAHIDVKGKVVLMMRYEPAAWGGAEGKWTPNVNPMNKVFLAKERGAVAVLFVNRASEEKDELYPFHVRGAAGNYGLPMFHVTRDFANRLLKAGGLDTLEILQKGIEDEKKMVSAYLADLKMKGDPGLKSVKAHARNVIGILPGKGPLAKEYVVFGAHYDHLGNVPPTRRPNIGGDFDPDKAEIHNGADDNASGTAGVLELARVFASGPPPKRTLIFMTFTSEEIGALGSRHFVEHPTVPLQDIVTMINLDMIGRLGDRPLQMLGAKTAKEFQHLLAKHGKEMGLELKLSDGAFGGSDHMHFDRKKIPVLFAFSGLHTDYHKPSDDADKIDYEGEARILRFVQAVADEVIQTGARPTHQVVQAPAGSGQTGFRVTMGIMPSYGEGDDQPGWAFDGVTPGRAAAKAGLKDRDRFLTINGKKINSVYDYMAALRNNHPGDVVEVVVLRGDKEVTFKVTLEGTTR